MMEGIVMNQNYTFKPGILAFCCHHCAYVAADLAGSLRQKYPTSIRIVEIPCSGKIEIIQVLQAFEQGVDGVMVAG
jgi:coenzyme F420-reducing hydrogenase delta subunit